MYYLVIKDINIGDELKVWYAPYYAKRMNSTTLLHSPTSQLDQTSGSFAADNVDFSMEEDGLCASFVNGSEDYGDHSDKQADVSDQVAPAVVNNTSDNNKVKSDCIFFFKK